MTMDDSDLRARISDLVAEERRLRDEIQQGERTPADVRTQLAAAEVELDRLWDLLRQREARREAGLGDRDAEERSANTVEGYEQ